MYTQEQIKDLANTMVLNSVCESGHVTEANLKLAEAAATKWFEQNSNIVFSEEQFEEICNLFDVMPVGNYAKDFRKYLADNNINVNELQPLVVGPTDTQIDRLTHNLWAHAQWHTIPEYIKKWFAEETVSGNFVLPNVHETVIGLNAEQFKHILMNTTPIGDFNLRSYLDSQTFDLDELHRFDADWDNAPPNANSYIVIERWYDTEGQCVGGNNLYKEQRSNNLITVNGFDIEDGSKDWKKGEQMYVVSLESDPMYVGRNYCSEWSQKVVSKGIAYKTKEGAIARAKAMLGIDPHSN